MLGWEIQSKIRHYSQRTPCSGTWKASDTVKRCLGQSLRALTAIWNGCETLLCNTAGSCLPLIHTFLPHCLSLLPLAVSSPALPNVFVCFLSCIPSFCIFPLFIHALFFFCSLCPSTSAPLPLLSLPRRNTYTDNTAATCCFGNILQQASVLHCSPFTQQPFLPWPYDAKQLLV